MEISNKLIPTMQAVDSPSQLSEENPQAPKNAKKKVAGEDSSFDGALATTISVQQAKADTQPKDLGKLGADIQSQKDEDIAAQVELSAKGKASAAATAGKAEGGAPAPTIASLFQAKAQQSANGPIAGSFVAGPDQPWGSRWVFAGGNQPSPEEIESARTSGPKSAPGNGALNLDQLKKLVEQAKTEGGDESQLKSAADSTLQDIDSAIAALGGELEDVRGTKSDESKAAPVVLGGAEYLSALQGVKGAAGSKTGANEGGIGGRSKDQMAAALAASESLSPNQIQGPVLKPDLQVIPGGLASGSEGEAGKLEGGLRLSKDEPNLQQTDTFYPNGMPLSAVANRNGQLGAVPPQMVTGHVVPGAMMRERLTSESLRNVSNGIAGMSGAGGGEMRIKLNPGNLGELMIRVSTNGKDVGLKVQANDPAAKKVIEESLGALRDSLAQQSLALGRVDVTLASTAANSDMSQNPQQNPSNAQNAFAGFDGRSPNQGQFTDGSGGSDDRSARSVESDRGVSRGISSRIAAMNSSGRSASAAAASRLDVMA
jgi:hypothetical protein